VNEISTNQSSCFGEFTLDAARAALFRGDEEPRLRQRTYEVLTHLVGNSGRLVSKQELFENIWRDVAVTDDSLVQCLVELRKALGDDQAWIKNADTPIALWTAAIASSQR
jgi:DNA-binding winged helix-turn-helix (wHTH) protein